MSEEAITLQGRVFTGLGVGTSFTQLAWARNQFVSKLAVDPHPGTLNIRAETREDLDKLGVLKMSTGICIEPENSQFCMAKGFKALVEGNVKAAIVIPMVTDYPPDILEIIAPVNFKESMGIKDGDLLSVTVFLD